MSAEARREAIFAAFKAGFISAPATPFVPVQYENSGFAQPATNWGRLTILEGDRGNASIGRDHKRTLGILVLQIFTPEGAGTKTARQAADKMAAVFDDLDLSTADGTIIFRAVTLSTVGLNKGGQYQQNATVEFYADEFESEHVADDFGVVVTDDSGVTVTAE